jgi:hypothetical protein
MLIKVRTVMSRDQNLRRSHNITFDNGSFERVEEFRYLETTLTNQNSHCCTVHSDIYTVHSLTNALLLNL